MLEKAKKGHRVCTRRLFLWAKPPVGCQLRVRKERRKHLMKYASLLLVALLICTLVGCSCISTTERENLTKLENREKYIEKNPDGLFNDCIRNGEIKKGMNIYEVIASWGLPNVYFSSEEEPKEFWVYYVQDTDTQSILIYTLAFDKDLLDGWDIDLKRFTGQGIAYDQDMPRTLPIKSGSGSTKKD
jgi:hypothetical protein